ncbi:MAG: adenine deaminase [Bacteroidales bacterium]|nr:adenine deaminase [Bacteroidales bacterium]
MKIYGKIIDVFNRRIFKGYISVKGKRIENIAEEDNPEENYILPGLIDSHIHIESSMLVPSRFAEKAVRHGTVAVVSDPHEIANVMGLEGLEFMIENSKTVPMKFYFGAPSCVPATSFERSGGKIGIKETELLLARNEIKYLAEMMNFPGVINKDREVMEKLESARKAGKPIDGHAPGLGGEDLDKYIGAGISTDHECISLNEAREKIDKGMKIQIREGSAASGLEKFHQLLADNTEMLMLCSDDLHPEMLEKGHINLLVKRLLAMGYDLFDILNIAITNPVKHYKLDAGLLRKGDNADFIIIDGPEEFNILETWIDGKRVFNGRNISFKTIAVKPLNNFHSGLISTDDIRVENAQARIRVIDAVDGEIVTGCYEWSPGESGKYIEADTEEDILKIIVKDRYNDAPPAVAYVRGFGLKEGAFASSVAHDSHNIIAVGVDDESICRAVNKIVEMKGGLAACRGDNCSQLQLEIAGIMSDVPCGTMASQYKQISDYVCDMACKLKSPFMTLSFMALLVIPELKLSDRGLFDGNKFEFVNLYL